MTYHYTQSRADAERYLAHEIARGRRGYILELNARTFEIRSWY